jgi:predicted permease
MFRKRRRDPSDFAEEIRSHLDLESDELKREGAAEAEARSTALRAFGNVTSTRERSYERGRLAWLDELMQDARYALRAMRRSPAYTAGVALVLALGIGANTAIYSFVEAVILRHLPLTDAQSLVLLKWHAADSPKVKRSISGEAHRDPSLGYVSGNFPYRAFEFLANNRVLSTTFGFFGGGDVTVLANGSADRAKSLFVSGRFFSGLQLAPSLGRMIDLEDERADGQAVAVLGHSYWQTRFGGNPAAVGQNILVNNAPFRVVGVAPRGFFGVDAGSNAQVYIPVRYYQPLRSAFSGNRNSMYQDDHWYWIQIMGRLQPGVSRQQAEAALSASFAGWVAATAENEADRKDLPLLYLLNGATGVDFLRVYYSKPLYLLAAMAGLILAVACANVANLQIARAFGRRREIVLRYGLGAGRWRIARQLLTECLLLSSVAGVASVLFAWAGMRGLSLLAASWAQDVQFRAEINWNCLLVSAALTLLTGLVFGLAPAIQVSRFQLAPGLKEVRSGAPAGWLRRMLPASGLRSGLVTVQIALSLLLVSGAWLFFRTVSNLRSVRLGFNPERVAIFEADARQAGHTGDAMGRFYGELERRLRTIPGVRAATSASYAPVSRSRSGTSVVLPGREKGIGTAVVWVGPDFFSTLQIPMALGREIGERDLASAPMVVVVNEAFVARHLPPGNPIGQSLRFGPPEDSPAVIVGVARNTQLVGLRDEVEPVVFGAYQQHLTRISRMTFLLRAANDSIPVIASARRIVESMDSRIPVIEVRTFEKQINGTIGQERLFAFLCSAFAGLALVIASVGLYGTLAYGVSRRTGEIGVRIALGARRVRVVSMILRESLSMIVAGFVIGLPLIWFSDKVIGAFLFRAAPNDPLTLVVPAAVLLVSALIAAGLPACRAARIDPIRALRHE